MRRLEQYLKRRLKKGKQGRPSKKALAAHGEAKSEKCPSVPVFPGFPHTNHLGGEDANGNAPGYTYDIENRIKVQMNGANLNAQYNYAPGNKRIWRGIYGSGQTLVTDEITFWSVAGQKLATYTLVENAWQGGGTMTPTIVATQTGTNYYFGGKLIKNAAGYVGADRLGSIGKYYPYGIERAKTNDGTEKFTGYLRDAETELDYAKNRYHAPGTGRFLTSDPYIASVGPRDPGSWNRYLYASGDPINGIDPNGLDTCFYVEGELDSCEDDVELKTTDMGGGGGGPSDGGHGGGGGGNDQGTGKVTAINNYATNSAVNTAWAGIRAVLPNSKNQDCENWLSAGLQSSGNSQYGTLDYFLGNVIPGLSGAGAFVGGSANGIALSPLLPSGSVIAVNTNGAFFNALPSGFDSNGNPFTTTIAPSNKYASQYAAIKGNTDEARVFILLHELAHVFQIISNNDAGTDPTSMANQKANNDAIWQNCGSVITSFSNKPYN